jgi:hypothetical protein
MGLSVRAAAADTSWRSTCDEARKRSTANGVAVDSARVHSHSTRLSKSSWVSGARRAGSTGLSTTIRMVFPIAMASPGSSGTRSCAGSLCSRSRVPLALFKSSIASPFSSQKSRACRLEARASASTMSALLSRPTRTALPAGRGCDEHRSGVMMRTRNPSAPAPVPVRWSRSVLAVDTSSIIRLHRRTDKRDRSAPACLGARGSGPRAQPPGRATAGTVRTSRSSDPCRG